MTSSCQVLSVEMIFFLESNCKLNEGLSFITMTTINFNLEWRYRSATSFLLIFFLHFLGFPLFFFNFSSIFFKFLQFFLKIFIPSTKTSSSSVLLPPLESRNSNLLLWDIPSWRFPPSHTLAYCGHFLLHLFGYICGSSSSVRPLSLVEKVKQCHRGRVPKSCRGRWMCSVAPGTWMERMSRKIFRPGSTHPMVCPLLLLLSAPVNQAERLMNFFSSPLHWILWRCRARSLRHWFSGVWPHPRLFCEDWWGEGSEMGRGHPDRHPESGKLRPGRLSLLKPAVTSQTNTFSWSPVAL